MQDAYYNQIVTLRMDTLPDREGYTPIKKCFLVLNLLPTMYIHVGQGKVQQSVCCVHVATACTLTHVHDRLREARTYSFILQRMDTIDNT